jgi:hypothetical protein
LHAHAKVALSGVGEVVRDREGDDARSCDSGHASRPARRNRNGDRSERRAGEGDALACIRSMPGPAPEPDLGRAERAVLRNDLAQARARLVVHDQIALEPDLSTCAPITLAQLEVLVGAQRFVVPAESQELRSPERAEVDRIRRARRALPPVRGVAE